MLKERQAHILSAVIREYVRQARPVSSAMLARRYRLGVSPATIRNEFAELTSKGYLRKPHASSGRAPTNRGYRYFVNVVFETVPRAAENPAKRVTCGIEALADMLAASSELLAAVWREDDKTSIRGFRQILAQPEFSSRDEAMRLAETIDALPRLLAKLFEFDSAAGVFIGNECPLWKNDDVSMLFRKVRFPNHAYGIACILGPTRMSYDTNWELLE